MSNIITRYDIQLNSDKDQITLDFILESTNKKVVHGTVWNNDLSNPKKVPEALVQIFTPGANYQNDPQDIKNVGYVITDISGEFFAGPFDPNAIVIFKIHKFDENTKTDYIENSFKTSEEN